MSRHSLLRKEGKLKIANEEGAGEVLVYYKRRQK